MFRYLLAALIVLALSAFGTAAAAQDKTLILLTEIEVSPDGSSTEAFWWSASAQPEWSSTDKLLRAKGLSFRPAGLERISRIYRRPELSDANAAALAELFGAETALVGTVRRETLPVSPLGEDVLLVSVDARLVQPSADGVVLRQSYSVERLARGDADVASRLATGQVADALVGLVASTLKRKVGPVGVSTDEMAITLHGVPSLDAWRLIRTRLGKRDGVTDVSVAWLAEGIIAVVVNAKTSETDDTVKRIARDLQNEVFESFELVAAPEEASSGTVALRVRAANNP